MMQLSQISPHELAALEGFFLELEGRRSQAARVLARGRALALADHLDRRGMTVAPHGAVLGSHPVQRLVVDRWTAPIDVGIARVIRQLWLRGIPTKGCCQGGTEYSDEEQLAYVGFPVLDDDYPGPFASWLYDVVLGATDDVRLLEHPDAAHAPGISCVRWTWSVTPRIVAVLERATTEPVRPWPTDLPLVDGGAYEPPPF